MNDSIYDPFGSVITDGSDVTEVVLEMPWGDVTPNPVALDKEQTIADVKFLSNQDFENVLDLLTIFGDAHTHAHTNITNKEIAILSEYYSSKRTGSL